MIRILIVDDDKLARKGLMSMLPWAKYDMEVVGEAANGQKALDFLRENPVDLMIVDLAMPVLSGLDLIRAVKELYPHVLFVVLTFHEDFDNVREALYLGALDYVSKLHLETENTEDILMRIRNRVEETRKHSARIARVSAETMTEARWTMLTNAIFSLHWLYDDLEYETLMERFLQKGIPVRRLEHAMVRLVLAVQTHTGLEGMIVPAFEDPQDAVDWFKSFRAHIYAQLSPGTQTDNMSATLLGVAEYVRSHIDEPLRAEAIAASINLSRSYFSISFGKLTGYAFNDFVRRERVRKAMRLLRETDLPLYEVAQRVGYEDVRYFARVFQEIVQTSPGDFRKGI